MNTITRIEIPAAGQQQVGFEADENGCRPIIGVPTVALHDDDEDIVLSLWTGHIMLTVHRWIDEATALSIAQSIAAELQANVTAETWQDIDLHLRLVAAGAQRATSLTPFEAYHYGNDAVETLRSLGAVTNATF
jgi:hypothetical protein